jgi:hypothetical protein
MDRTDAEIALEVYESVRQSSNKQKKLLSSTFWKRFNVHNRNKPRVERIAQLLHEHGLKITVKSGALLGKEKWNEDWIILTLSLDTNGGDHNGTKIPVQPPPPEWLQTMQARKYETEGQVVAFFFVPLLEKLGYSYDDIVIGYPVEMFKGVQRTVKEADIVVFNGPTREKKDVLLLVEAKKIDKGINLDHIGQAKSYAQELLPACYIVSNGQQIKVFQFNGMLAPDECVMDFNRSELGNKWESFYNYASKEATTRRKEWMKEKLKKPGAA